MMCIFALTLDQTSIFNNMFYNASRLPSGAWTIGVISLWGPTILDGSVSCHVGSKMGKATATGKNGLKHEKNTLFHEHWSKIINQLILDVFNVSILLVCALTC